jgi:hypothetical protein
VGLRLTAFAVLTVGLLAGCEGTLLPGKVPGDGGRGPGGGGGGGGPRLIDSGAPDEVDAGRPPAPGEPDAGSTEPPPDPGDPCMGLDFLGECDGDVARWCNREGMLEEEDCAARGMRCRWIDDETGFYCGEGGSSPPPPSDAGGGGTPPPSGDCASAVEMEELVLTNMARSSAGLAPLTCDPGLARAARLHSQDMCDGGYFDHSSRDGRSFTDRIDEQGVRYGAAGENIAWGQQTPEEVHSGWMSSPGHRANILGREYRRIGIGYVPCGGSPLWTQDFTD